MPWSPLRLSKIQVFFYNCWKIHIPFTLSSDTIVQVGQSKTPSNKELGWQSKIFLFPQVFLLVTEINCKNYDHNAFLKYNHNTSYTRKGRKELFPQDYSSGIFKKQEIHVPRVQLSDEFSFTNTEITWLKAACLYRLFDITAKTAFSLIICPKSLSTFA